MATEADAQSKSKLEEQATGKADLSYSYFLANSNGQAGPAPPPRKLTEEEVRQQQEMERQKSAQGSSAWNHAGTFEERCVTEWAKDRLKLKLRDLSKGGVTITDVNSITGDANIWIVRGKRRQGFHLEATLAWKAEVSNGQEVRGHLKVTNIDSDDLDDMVLAPEVLHKQAGWEAAEAEALRKASAMQEVLREVLEQLQEELKQK